MADRKKLKSANGLYLGSTGSGKSFAAKREIINVFLAIPKDRIIIVDPMGAVSYTHLDVYKRQGWTSKGQLKGTVNDFNKVMDAIRYLREKELSTVESLDTYLDTVSEQAVSIRAEMKPKEKRMKEIDTLLSHIASFEAHKPVHTEYAAIRFKKPKEQFATAHRDELDAYNAAVRYFKVHLEGTKYSTKKLNEERTQLAGEVAEYKDCLLYTSAARPDFG